MKVTETITHGDCIAGMQGSREISDDRYSFAPALLVGFIVLAAFAALTAEAINIVRSRRRQ